jgi:hypothetical protein
MKIELLYFDGCPSYQALRPKLEALLAREGVEDEIELRQVETSEAAEDERFLGSPTLRIDGEDVDPGAAARSDFGMKCRLYRSAEGAAGVPPEDWIAEAIQRRKRKS